MPDTLRSLTRLASARNAFARNVKRSEGAFGDPEPKALSLETDTRGVRK